MDKKTTQAQRVLDYMREFGSITPLEAMADLGVMRLAARIADLKRAGYAIERRTVQVKNRYGQICNVAQYSERVTADGRR